MKTIYYAITIFSFLIISCSSNDELTEIAPGNDLSIIAQTLELLQTDFMNDSSDKLSKKYNPKNAKSLKKAFNNCIHEQSSEESEEGVTIKMTVKLFDGKGNPITDCELTESAENFPESPINYAIEQTVNTIATGFAMDMYTYTRVAASFKIGLTTATYSETYNTDLTVFMDLNETVFNFLEGSYMNLAKSFSFDQNTSEQEIDRLFEEEPSIEVKFILGLDANGNDYHFNLLLLNEDFQGSKVEKDFDLLNTSNIKVGTIKYTLHSSGSEEFKVHDLNGNLVE